MSFGSWLDGVGTNLNLPEIGLSEMFNGGKTQNTGRVGYNAGAAGALAAVNPLSTNLTVPGAVAYANATRSGSTGGTTKTSNGNGGSGAVDNSTIDGSGLATSYNGAGGGGSAPARNLAAESMYQSGINQTNNLLGQIGTRQQTALQSLLAAREAARARAQNSFKDYETDYTTNVDRMTRQNAQKKSQIDTQVRNNMTALQRLLASRGAGSSSAAQFAVPNAVAQKGTSDRFDTQQVFNDNMDATNTNWKRYRREFDQAQADADADYTNKERSTRSQFAEQETGLRQKLQEMEINLANARGGDQGAIARATDQNALIANLQNLITQLSAQTQGQTINYNDPKYNQAETKAYNDNVDYSLSTGQTQEQANDPQYYYDKPQEDEDLLRNLYGAAA